MSVSSLLTHIPLSRKMAPFICSLLPPLPIGILSFCPKPSSKPHVPWSLSGSQRFRNGLSYIWLFQTHWRPWKRLSWIGHESFLLDSPQAPSGGCWSHKKPAPRRQAPLSVKDLGNPSFQLLGDSADWDQEQRLLKVFLAVSPQGSKDGCDDLQQPHLSQRSEVGISSHQLQHTWPEDLFQLHCGVWELLLSLGVLTSWKPLITALGLSSCVRSGLSLVVSCCGFSTDPDSWVTWFSSLLSSVQLLHICLQTV